MSKSLRNADNSTVAHSTAAAQRQRNDTSSEIAASLSERFTILETISESENHILYLARDLNLARDLDPARDLGDSQPEDQLVRVKVLRESAANDERQLSLFRLEALAAAKLSHKNIVKAAEAEAIRGLHFCVTEHKAQAETLRNLLFREGWLETERGIEIIRQIAEALDYAHSLGVLHLTLQPENVLVEPDGVVLVAGFGIESEKELLWARQERSHTCAAQYISPEQVRCKQIDRRSDLYSLGVVMFEVLTDRVPFDSQDPISIKLKHLNKHPEPPHMFRPELPRLLCWLVMDLLKKNPDERVDSAGSFLSILQQCIEAGLEPGNAIDAPEENRDPVSEVAGSGQIEAETPPVQALPVSHELPMSQELPLPVESLPAPPSPGALEPGDRAKEATAGGLVAPLIVAPQISVDDDGPALAETRNNETQNDSDEAYFNEPFASIDNRPPHRPYEFQMMPAMSEATRSRRLAWLAAILLVAAIAIIWAMRAPRLQNSAGVEPPALAAEARESEAQKPEAPPTGAAPTEPEKITQAVADKAVVKNSDDREKETEAAAASKNLPEQAKSHVLKPPVVSTVSSADHREPNTPGLTDRVELGNAQPAEQPTEPPPATQSPKREEPPVPRMVRRSGDVLQNSAISRVRPAYPEAARSARITGPVTVEVTVDEEGNVIAARAISGPDALKEAAVNAARGWKWMPTRIDRMRVKVVGTITLNFQR
jgi:TonB family protein